MSDRMLVLVAALAAGILGLVVYPAAGIVWLVGTSGAVLLAWRDRELRGDSILRDLRDWLGLDR